MRLIRNILIVLLSLSILVACAWLPYLDGIRLDRQTQNTVVFEDVNAIELDLSESEDPNSLSPLSKLAILRNGDYVAIGEADLNTERSFELSEQLIAGMQPYVNALLIDPVILEDTICQSTDLLFVSYDAIPEQGFLMWHINLTTASDPDLILDVFLDNDTGRILCLSYSHEIADMEDLEESRDAAVEIYLEGLGLSGEELSGIAVEPVEHAIDGYEYAYALSRLSFTDENYGEVILEFSYSSYGFYMGFV